MRRLRLLFVLAAALLPFAAGAQVYVSDYTFSTYTSSFNSIASTGTEMTQLSGYSSSQELVLPFTFHFGQDSCTVVTVGNLGQIAIGQGSPSFPGYVHGDNEMSIISPFGFECDPTDAHTYYEVMGTAPNRSVVIEYRNRHAISDTDTVAYQTVLYETGDIEFIYDTCHFVSDVDQVVVFLHEQTMGRTLSVAGTWSSPSTSQHLSPLVFSNTQGPSYGMTFSFMREERSCLRPLNFICSSFSRPDSVSFTWNSAPYTSMWELRYDTVGTPADSMSNIFPYLSDSVVVCTTMVAGGVYDVYLRTDCGSEYSFWEGPNTVTPGSYNMPATGTHTIYACGGTIYDDGGPTGNYSNNCNSTLVIMPSAADSMVVVNGTLTSENSYDHLYIYDGVGTSGQLLYHGTGSGNIISNIVSLSGPVTLRFTSDVSVQQTGFALTVSCVGAPHCRYVNNVEVSHIAGASAFLEWDLVGSTAMPSYFIVRVENLSDPTLPSFTDTTSNHFYMLSGLDQLTNYRARISTYCEGEQVIGDSVDFVTRSYAGGTSLPSGTQTLQSSGVPVMSSWGNTFCQSIFTPADLSAMGITPGPIQGVIYTWASAGSYQKDIVLFMGHTTNSVFTSTTPLTGSMTQVYSGTRNTTDVGPTEYIFTAPFVWDGVHSIVLSSFVNQPAGASHVSSGFNAYSSSTPGYSSLYSYKDNTAYTMSNLTSSTFYYSSNRPNVSFILPADTLATCVAPNVIITKVLSDSIELIWAPGRFESMWNVYYKTVEDTVWTLSGLNITSRSHVITPLNPMTEYEIRVVPDCGGDSVATILSATTPCVPLTTLPFTEDFEHFTASSTLGTPITPCWFRGSNYTYSNYPYLSSSYRNSGTYSIYFYSSSSYYSYLALPAIGVSLDSLQVAFALYKTSTNYSISVGTMTDPDDYSTFSQIATVSPSAISMWENFEVPLTGADSSAKHIAFAVGGSSNAVYLDDIEVDYIPTCIRPHNVTVSSVTSTTATVRWTAPGVNYFEIEYGPAGFTRGTGTLATSVNDSVNLYGLTHSTRYEIYVRAMCSITDTSNWSFPTYFYTDCGVIDSLPYSTNFRSYATGSSSRPYCWAAGGYSSYPFITDVVAADGITHRSLYMYSYASNMVYASMPELDSVSYPINVVQTAFTAWTTSATATPQCIVGVCSEQGDLSTFIPVDTVLLSNARVTYEVSFEEVTGAGKYITFVSTSRDMSTSNVFYIDSVSISMIPSCQSPNRPNVVNATHNTATIGWNPRSLATEWQIEYGPHGFMQGTGTRLFTTTNPVTITGLNPSSQYDFYLRSVCGPSDTSDWSLTVGQFATRQIPAPVPYYYDFETAAEWENWQTNSNTTINWYRDTAAGDGTPGFGNTSYYSMFISADSGLTYSTDLNQVVNASAYRDIDFGPVDSSFTLSFRARVGGTPSQGWDALMVFLVNPDVPVVASNANITSPWGMVNDLTPLVAVRVSPNWNTYNVVLDTLSGVRRLAFFWFNQSTSGTPFLGGPAAVDNISINYIDCPRPAAVQAARVTTTTADIEWFGPENGDYHFICRSVTGVLIDDQLIHTNHYHVTGLMPGARYSIFLRRICSDTDSSNLTAGFTFMTLQCNDGYVDTIGSTASTTTSYNVPVNNYYNYTYTQQIITSDELPSAGSITAINLNYAYASAMTSKTNCTIYMGHTSLSSFPTTSTMASPDSMQIVYTGNLNCVQGWNRFILNYPFDYNGTSNLVIAVDDNSGSYNSMSHTFYVSPTSQSMSLSLSSDEYNPDASSAEALNAFSGVRSVYAYRNQMVLEFCPPSSCPKPILRDPIIRSNSVTLRWRNTGSSYQVGYRLASTTSWISNEIATEDTFYVIHNVLPLSDYVYQVRQICDSTGISNWQMGEFNSNDIPCLSPTGLEVTSVTNNKVDLRWQPEENNIGYRLHVYNSYFDRYVNSYAAHKSVSGLDANMTYYATVQASCQDMDDPSEWSDTITFTTDFCPDATNLTYSDLQGNSVVLDWTEGGRAEQWEVQYGYAGFEEGTGFSVIVDSHPYTLTGLIGENMYDIYVRSICGDNYYSEHWSNCVTITTPYSGIASVSDDARIHLAPNPTSADVTLTLPATTSAVLVEVMDLAGRVQFTTTLPAGTESTVLAASQLSQGAYFVKITADNINAIKKLIVR